MIFRWHVFATANRFSRMPIWNLNAYGQTPWRRRNPERDKRSDLTEVSAGDAEARKQGRRQRGPQRQTHPLHSFASRTLRQQTTADIAKPVDSCPQKGAVRQGGGIVPSGLLQPPGRSSSAVIRVPRRGQPTKIAKAESPHPRPVAKWTTRVNPEPSAG